MIARFRRPKKLARRVFVRPFAGAACRGDFETLQTRLLGKFAPLNAVENDAFENVMTVIWKRNFRTVVMPRRRG